MLFQQKSSHTGKKKIQHVLNFNMVPALMFISDIMDLLSLEVPHKSTFSESNGITKEVIITLSVTLPVYGLYVF